MGYKTVMGRKNKMLYFFTLTDCIIFIIVYFAWNYTLSHMGHTDISFVVEDQANLKRNNPDPRPPLPLKKKYLTLVPDLYLKEKTYSLDHHVKTEGEKPNKRKLIQALYLIIGKLKYITFLKEAPMTSRE